MQQSRTIEGCDASWTMTISVDPLGPDESDPLGPDESHRQPDTLGFPMTVFRTLEQVFQDSVDLYECRRFIESG